MSSEQQLKKIDDASKILDFVNGAKEQALEVFVWRFVGGAKHLALSRIEAVRKLRNDFCIIPADGQDKQLQEIIGSQHQIDLYIPDYALLLRCNLRHTDAPQRYYLEFPNFVAQAERRKSQRLDVSDEGAVKISFAKSVTYPKPLSQHFHKTCHDISAGGFSFDVSRTEAKLFQPQDLMEIKELKLEGMSTKAQAQILGIKEIEPNERNGLAYKVWRVSCRFTEIDHVSKKRLQQYIFERIKDELHAING